MTDHPGSSQERGGLVGWIISHPIATAALVLLLLLVGVVWLLDAAAETRLQRRLDAIRASGAPLTLDDLNDAMPQIPDDENMAIPILEAAAEITAVKIPEDTYAKLPLIRRGRTPLTGERLSETEAAAARWYLDQVDEPLARIHDALELDRGCVEVTWTTPALEVLLHHITGFRFVTKTLALEATLAAEEGNPERAGEVIEAMFRFDRVQECDRSMIGFIVRIACMGLTQDQIERTVNLGSLEDHMLERFAHQLAEHEGVLDMRRAIMTERVFTLDTMRWVRGAPRGSVGNYMPGGDPALGRFYRLIPVMPALDQSRALDIYAEIIQAADRPDGDAIRDAKAAEAKLQTVPSYCILTRSLVPYMSRAIELWVRTVGSSRALRAGLACERYRLATGTWPETLDALVPSYLDTVPVDPFDDQPIRYAHIDEGIKVWSIGEDMKDNGGDVKRLKRGKNEKPTDFGWVFLNPELRGRPAETGDD